MSNQKFVISVLAVFATFQILDAFIHMVVLRETYEELEGLWRTNMNETVWVIFLTGLVQSIIFVYFFTVGVEGKGVREGIRFGFIFGLLMSFVSIFNQYAVYPIPLWLAWQWFAYGLIQFMVCGIVVALIYQSNKEKA